MSSTLSVVTWCLSLPCALCSMLLMVHPQLLIGLPESLSKSTSVAPVAKATHVFDEAVGYPLRLCILEHGRQSSKVRQLFLNGRERRPEGSALSAGSRDIVRLVHHDNRILENGVEATA